MPLGEDVIRGTVQPCRHELEVRVRRERVAGQTDAITSIQCRYCDQNFSVERLLVDLYNAQQQVMR